ncbi:MAG: 16S rRNA (cytidine(1402)-2'-O)-methyltransferase [bacterium]|nr:16S rRNA (cytidine(1402)-2'-O)-methyltransferase [bacterium]
MEKGSLYVVATPIGNLADMTFRAVQILQSVELIAAEDTRRSATLLTHYDIKTPSTSYHDFTRPEKRQQLLRKILAGSNVALISDAGTPGIADPGYRLVSEAVALGIEVAAIPGPSVLTSALSVSGLATNAFFFSGYLPQGAGPRTRALESLKTRVETLVLYEAPHRCLASLEAMHTVLGNRRIAVAREMTKRHEETFRGTIQEALNHFRGKERIRGELTLVVEGAGDSGNPANDCDLARTVRRMIKEAKLTRKDAVRMVSIALEVPRNQVYRASLQNEENETNTG